MKKTGGRKSRDTLPLNGNLWYLALSQNNRNLSIKTKPVAQFVRYAVQKPDIYCCICAANRDRLVYMKIQINFGTVYILFEQCNFLPSVTDTRGNQSIICLDQLTEAAEPTFSVF